VLVSAAKRWLIGLLYRDAVDQALHTQPS